MELPVATERGAADELARALREAIQRLNRRVRQTRPVGDLTYGQLSALTSLQLAGALTPRELADVERVQPPTMTKIVGKLEERGLVVRTPHPTDGRQVILAPTEQGRRALGAAQVGRGDRVSGVHLQPDFGWGHLPPPLVAGVAP